MTFRHRMFASILFWPLALGGAGDRATVKTEAAPVYSHQRSSPEEIVTTLKRGDAVFVELTLSSAEGDWCEVAGAAGSGMRGFMRCADLEREQAGGSLAARYIPGASPSAPGVKAPAARLSPAQMAGEDYVRPIQLWTGAFAFTAEQQAAVTELARRLGVPACRERIEAHVQAYEKELTSPPAMPPRQRVDRMVRDFNSFAHPCLVTRLALLERLPEMMTPGQQADAKRLAAFKKELASQRQVLMPPGTFPGAR